MKKIFYVILLIIFLVPLNVFAKDVGNQGFYLFYDYAEKPVDSSGFTIQCCGNASAEFTAGFVLKDGYDYADEPLYIDLYFDLWVENRPNFMEEISKYLTASLYNNGNYGNLAKSVNISRYADGGYGIRVRLKIEPPSSSNTAIMVGFILTNGWWHSTTLRYVSYDIFYQSDKSLRDNADKSAQIYNQNQQIIDQNAATNDKLDETNDKLDAQIKQEEAAEETRKGIWETIKDLPSAFLDMLLGLFVPNDMSFVTDFVDALESKLGFIASIPVQIIEFAINLVTASWDTFDSISFPSIEVFGYKFWDAQEIDLTEAINIFKPFKYVTDVICVVICARTLNKWRETFTGGN